MDILLHGHKAPVRIAEDPEKCVAIGTARAFGYLDQLTDALSTRRRIRTNCHGRILQAVFICGFVLRTSAAAGRINVKMRLPAPFSHFPTVPCLCLLYFKDNSTLKIRPLLRTDFVRHNHFN
jgi:hypothetical protein